MLKSVSQADAYLRPGQTSVMELFPSWHLYLQN